MLLRKYILNYITAFINLHYCLFMDRSYFILHMGIHLSILQKQTKN